MISRKAFLQGSLGLISANLLGCGPADEVSPAQVRLNDQGGPGSGSGGPGSGSGNFVESGAGGGKGSGSGPGGGSPAGSGPGGGQAAGSGGGDVITGSGGAGGGGTGGGDVITGSGGAGGGNGGPTCEDDPNAVPDHPWHPEFTIPLADVEAGVDAVYDVPSPNHTHQITVTAADFDALEQDGEVTVVSTFEEGHTHEVVITCNVVQP